MPMCVSRASSRPMRPRFAAGVRSSRACRVPPSATFRAMRVRCRLQSGRCGTQSGAANQAPSRFASKLERPKTAPEQARNGLGIGGACRKTVTFGSASTRWFRMFPRTLRLPGFDDELADAIDAERRRQEDHVELIASENYASPRVLEAQGSVLTNKYAEGYPGKRYYGGCEFVDIAEQLAIDRVKQLFDCDYANVQPHSGSQANQAVYTAVLAPGDRILGMSLAH